MVLQAVESLGCWASRLLVLWVSGLWAPGLLVLWVLEPLWVSRPLRCWAAGFLDLWVPVGLQDVGSLGLWAPGGLQATGPGCTGLSRAKGLASWALGGPPGLWFWAQAYAAGALTESCKNTNIQTVKDKVTGRTC